MFILKSQTYRVVLIRQHKSLLQSTTGISAQQPFAAAIGKKIRFTGESVKAQVVLQVMNPVTTAFPQKGRYLLLCPKFFQNLNTKKPLLSIGT
jgi:hypothetical protein